MRKNRLLATCMVALFPVAAVAATAQASSQVKIVLNVGQPSVYFIEPADGAVLENPVSVKFGVKNFGVAPAGIDRENTGHHHLIIDAPLPDVENPVPFDEKHVHFGAGQTETILELAPGKHTLQLLMGDYAHRPHAKPLYSEVITITVK